MLLPRIEIDYIAHFFGEAWGEGHASLIHPHVGLLMAVALLARDRRVLAAAFAAILLGWHARVLWSGQVAWPHWAIVTANMVVLWWWTERCARWIGAPFSGLHPFGVRDLPRFVAIGLVVFPLGWAALVCFMHLVLGSPPTWIGNEGLQQFFAKYIGVACVTLPLLLFWIDGNPGGSRMRRFAGAWAWLGCALLLAALLGGLPPGVADTPLAWLFDYRLTVGALLAVAILALKPVWSMPLLSLAHFVLLHALAGLAQGTDDAGGVAVLLLHTLELNLMALLLVGLYLVNRERTQALRSAEDSGQRDAATGLANSNALQRTWLRLQRPPQAIGFLVLDHVDRLVSGYGWPAQAAMLRDVAHLLAPATRVYYLGGGQFVLLPDDDPAHGPAPEAWGELLRLLQRHTFAWHGSELSVTPYLGLATPRSLGMRHLHECIADACEAAMQARQRGETAPVAALEEGGAETAAQARRAKLVIASDALACIRSGQIELHVQPIVRIDGGWPGGGGFHGEVLCRLRARNGELILPDRFIGELEADGHVAELDLAVVESLFAYLRGHPEACRGIARIGINLSGFSLSSDSFRSRLVELLQQAPIRHDALCFELTETAVIARFGSAMRLFMELRAMGCRMALDDFGSGMQNFERLKQIPVDVIKIDGQFVRQVHVHGSDFEIVQAAIAVARAYGLATVAEYVENREVLDCLRRMGIQWGQGHHLGRPQPISEYLGVAA